MKLSKEAKERISFLATIASFFVSIIGIFPEVRILALILTPICIIITIDIVKRDRSTQHQNQSLNGIEDSDVTDLDFEFDKQRQSSVKYPIKRKTLVHKNEYVPHVRRASLTQRSNEIYEDIKIPHGRSGFKEVFQLALSKLMQKSSLKALKISALLITLFIVFLLLFNPFHQSPYIIHDVSDVKQTFSIQVGGSIDVFNRWETSTPAPNCASIQSPSPSVVPTTTPTPTANCTPTPNRTLIPALSPTAPTHH